MASIPTLDPTAIRLDLQRLADSGMAHSEYALDLRQRLKELAGTPDPREHSETSPQAPAATPCSTLQ